MTDAPRGIGVSPGAAVGPVVQVRPPVRPPETEPAPADPAAEHQRVKDVFESVAQTLETWSEDHPDRAIQATGVPRYLDLVKNGVGHYLLNPAVAPAAKVVYE